MCPVVCEEGPCLWALAYCTVTLGRSLVLALALLHSLLTPGWVSVHLALAHLALCVVCKHWSTVPPFPPNQLLLQHSLGVLYATLTLFSLLWTTFGLVFGMDGCVVTWMRWNQEFHLRRSISQELERGSTRNQSGWEALDYSFPTRAYTPKSTWYFACGGHFFEAMSHLPIWDMRWFSFDSRYLPQFSFDSSHLFCVGSDSATPSTGRWFGAIWIGGCGARVDLVGF